MKRGQLVSVAGTSTTGKEITLVGKVVHPYDPHSGELKIVFQDVYNKRFTYLPKQREVHTWNRLTLVECEPIELVK